MKRERISYKRPYNNNQPLKYMKLDNKKQKVLLIFMPVAGEKQIFDEQDEDE